MFTIINGKKNDKLREIEFSLDFVRDDSVNLMAKIDSSPKIYILNISLDDNDLLVEIHKRVGMNKIIRIKHLEQDMCHTECWGIINE